jgi:hypothetical protein
VPDVLASLPLVLNLLLAIVLIRKYLHTRDVGFIWLGVAVVIRPLLSRILRHLLVDDIVSKQLQISIGKALYITQATQEAVGVVLVWVAVFYLCRPQPSTASLAAARAR